MIQTTEILIGHAEIAAQIPTAAIDDRRRLEDRRFRHICSDRDRPRRDKCERSDERGF
jgi:hypothetical protein